MGYTEVTDEQLTADNQDLHSWIPCLEHGFNVRDVERVFLTIKLANAGERDLRAEIHRSTHDRGCPKRVDRYPLHTTLQVSRSSESSPYFPADPPSISPPQRTAERPFSKMRTASQDVQWHRTVHRRQFYECWEPVKHSCSRKRELNLILKSKTPFQSQASEMVQLFQDPDRVRTGSAKH